MGYMQKQTKPKNGLKKHTIQRKITVYRNVFLEKRVCEHSMFPNIFKHIWYFYALVVKNLQHL